MISTVILKLKLGTSLLDVTASKMGKPKEITNNNNDTSENIKKIKENKSDEDKKSGAQTAIVLGLIGGLIALLLKNSVKQSSTNSSVIGARDPSLYRGMHGLRDEYDLIVVGAGLSGRDQENISGIILTSVSKVL